MNLAKDNHEIRSYTSNMAAKKNQVEIISNICNQMLTGWN